MLGNKISYNKAYISQKFFSKLIYVRKLICLKRYSLMVTNGIREIKIDDIYMGMSGIYMDF